MNSKSVKNKISDTFHLFLGKLIAESFQNGSISSEIRLHLKAYCIAEHVHFESLRNDLDLLMGLLLDYQAAPNSVLYRYVLAQAKRCFVEDKIFQQLLLPVFEVKDEEECGSFTDEMSSGSFDLVGAHLIGLY